jgi:hypothetical protein
MARRGKLDLKMVIMKEVIDQDGRFCVIALLH